VHYYTKLPCNLQSFLLVSGGQMGKFQDEAGLLDWSYKYVDQLDVFYACVI